MEIMGFDGAGLSVGTNTEMLPLSCVALYFIWHLAVSAVSDAVEILKMAPDYSAFVSSYVTRMCKWLVFWRPRSSGEQLENAAQFWQLFYEDITRLQ